VASSVSLGVPFALDTAYDSAADPFRTFDVGSRVINAGTASANQVGGGVFPGGGAMAVNAGSGMSVVVAAGLCCVPNSTSALQGGYITGTMTSASLTLDSADSGNYRIDVIAVTVNDTGFPSSNAVVAVTTGTPASSPSAPDAPANSIVLAQVLVPPGSSSISTGNITDERSYVVAPGGVLPIPSSSVAPAAPAWQLFYDIAAGAVVQGSGSAGSTAPLTLLPWSPVVSVQTSNVNDGSANGVLTAITTASITVDGSTDIEVFYKWTGLKASGSVPLLCTMSVSIDGTVLDQAVISIPSTSVYGAGGSARFYSSAAQSNTPSAGTHTVSFGFQSASSSVTTTLSASSSAPAMLRVAPAAS
jgi:hypothetical protein